jgi:KUP system potassium uptake protein
VITIGSGALYVKSMFQKLVSKSSTEAELIGLSDTIGQVVWTRNFLEALEYNMEPATVYQDNLSTIAMVHNGAPTSHRTRHINIRFFFTKDMEERKEIKLEYCPTEDMLADFFTKPLQGALFIRMRDKILGASH